MGSAGPEPRSARAWTLRATLSVGGSAPGKRRPSYDHHSATLGLHLTQLTSSSNQNHTETRLTLGKPACRDGICRLESRSPSAEDYSSDHTGSRRVHQLPYSRFSPPRRGGRGSLRDGERRLVLSLQRIRRSRLSQVILVVNGKNRSSLHFSPDKPLPGALVLWLIKARIGELEKFRANAAKEQN